MGRREQPATELSPVSDPVGQSPAWSQWRPCRHIGFLAVTVVLMSLWLAFLLAMILRK